ncbi:hypothetical protein D3C85_1938190 [compost metagenome]
MLVCAQPWKSSTEPLSVATTARVSPGERVSSSFLALTMGMGHLRPFTSRVLVVFR